MSDNIDNTNRLDNTNKVNKTDKVDKKKIAIYIIIGVIIIGVIIAVICIILKYKTNVFNKNEKEGFKESTDKNTVEVNGHYIDCSPEIEYMNEFIKTSKGLS